MITDLQAYCEPKNMNNDIMNSHNFVETEPHTRIFQKQQSIHYSSKDFASLDLHRADSRNGSDRRT
jgi:hypothetical protein